MRRRCVVSRRKKRIRVKQLAEPTHDAGRSLTHDFLGLLVPRRRQLEPQREPLVIAESRVASGDRAVHGLRGARMEAAVLLSHPGVEREVLVPAQDAQQALGGIRPEPVLLPGSPRARSPRTCRDAPRRRDRVGRARSGARSATARRPDSRSAPCGQSVAGEKAAMASGSGKRAVLSGQRDQPRDHAARGLPAAVGRQQHLDGVFEERRANAAFARRRRAGHAAAAGSPASAGSSAERSRSSEKTRSAIRFRADAGSPPLATRRSAATRNRSGTGPRRRS